MARSLTYFQNLTHDELVKEAFLLGLCDRGFSINLALSRSLHEVEVLREKLEAVGAAPAPSFPPLPPGFNLGTQ